MKKSVFIASLLVFVHSLVNSQSLFAPLNTEYYHLLDRQEILKGKQAEYHTSFKPYAREKIAKEIETTPTNLSKVDSFNSNYILQDNIEYLENKQINPSKPLLKHFYTQRNAFWSKIEKDYSLFVNPIINFGVGKSNLLDNKLYLNTRGIEVRGNIGKNIGFYSLFTDNQMATPSYVNNFIINGQALPGEGFYKPFKTSGYDFLSARGYFTVKANKYINLQFGQDKNFVGNGFRSLVLSDFSNPSLFLKVQTQFWKLQYTNLFAQMKSVVGGTNQYYPNKYMALHHLSLNVTKNINIGLFESIIFHRNDSIGGANFDFAYLNPIIFYRWAEQNNGSLDNANIGVDFKINALKRVQAYGAVFVDEFLLEDFKAKNGAWTNKQAFQLGAKYFNVANVKNLDIQLEYNYIRPYTYAHFNNGSNYTQYGQSLAHPMGANLKELVAVARYQPLNKLTLKSQLVYTSQGIDPDASLGANNYGGNIFKSYSQVAGFHIVGNKIGQGIDYKVVNASLSASYMFYHNLFLDFNFTNRIANLNGTKTNEKIVMFGLRMNIAKRNFDF